MSKRRNSATQYAVCINNTGYEASLEVGKLYQVLPDDKANEHGYMSVVDESGEAYLFAATRFFPMKIPAQLARALETAT